MEYNIPYYVIIYFIFSLHVSLSIVISPSNLHDFISSLMSNLWPLFLWPTTFLTFLYTFHSTRLSSYLYLSCRLSLMRLYHSNPLFSSFLTTPAMAYLTKATSYIFILNPVQPYHTTRLNILISPTSISTDFINLINTQTYTSSYSQ